MCTCHVHEQVSKRLFPVPQIAASVVNRINLELEPHKDRCAMLSLLNVSSAYRHGVGKFVGSRDDVSHYFSL